MPTTRRSFFPGHSDIIAAFTISSRNATITITMIVTFLTITTIRITSIIWVAVEDKLKSLYWGNPINSYL